MLPPPRAMHRTKNNSVHNTVYTDTVTDPPPRNTQYGLDTSSYAAASSITAVPTGIQDYLRYASYLTSNDPYGYGTTGYQDYYSVNPQQGNEPYTPQVGGSQNSGSPYQPLTSSQDSGSSYLSLYNNTGDYQTSGRLVRSANLWNDSSSYEDYPFPHYSDYTPAYSPNAQSSSSLAVTDGYYCQPIIILNDLSRYSLSHIQQPPGTMSWQAQVDSSGTPSWNPDCSSSISTSWRPESISSATTSRKHEPSPWKFMPTPGTTSSSTTSRGPDSSSTSWRPEPTASSTTSWRPEPTSTSTMSWTPRPISSGLPTVQFCGTVGAFGRYCRSSLAKKNLRD
ncbi:hypothetical protein MKX01_040112 [Papaver californicum]|nr:hypothetical protein MKX01_040112 [Papaver californicum]